jgi:FkbH-like protein
MNDFTQREGEEAKVKCVVWDLDNTIWNGTLLEDNQVTLREGVIDVIKILDNRGILQSIASRNDLKAAMAKLQEFHLWEYFLYPQINWGPKSDSIRAIAKAIDIGIDSMAFIDDQQFEIAEVQYSHPRILCIDARHIGQLPQLSAMSPRFLTDESKKRRLMYLSEMRRNEVEATFAGPKEEFLASLDMILSIGPASKEDLQRAEELTIRTHQLNTTGYTYSYDELDYFRQSAQYKLLIADLEDKYGSYGKIGLALIETSDELWIIKLLLISCRVVSRGVGTAMINHIRNQARAHGVVLQAEFLSTDVNRMMYMTYKFTHFRELYRDGRYVLLQSDCSELQAYPSYLRVMSC